MRTGNGEKRSAEQNRTEGPRAGECDGRRLERLQLSVPRADPRGNGLGEEEEAGAVETGCGSPQSIENPTTSQSMYLPKPVFSVGQFYTLITCTGSFEGLRLFLGDDEQYAQGFSDRRRAFMMTNIVLESNFRLSDENVRQQRLANYPKCSVERDENRYVAM